MVKRRWMLSLVAAMLAACATAPEPPPVPAADAATERSIANGRLVGFTHPDTKGHVWRAVPYAAPPVGDLRWRAPRPASDWQGVREAVTETPWCVQPRSTLETDGVSTAEIAGQEDCLYLDIYAPALAPDKAAQSDLPVMLWIHGGSNTWGRAAQYDPSLLATRHNVIVAVMQYRLGPLGWFAHDSLAAGAQTRDDRSPNFGTLDQIAALNWIKSNIDAFGGDTRRVTVFGESAGGHNTVAMLASPLARGLFHRAIIQSGSFRSTSMAEAKGGPDGRKDAGWAIGKALTGQETPSAAALRAVSAEQLYAAYRAVSPELENPRIIEDGIALPAGPMSDAFRTVTGFASVPIITGTNKDEAKLFQIFDPKLTRMIAGRIPRARDADLYDAYSDYQSRLWRLRAVDIPAATMTAAGHAPVYAYRFDWDEGGKAYGSDFSRLIGAAHAVEIPFVFGRFVFLGRADQWMFNASNEAGRVALSDAMMSYWAHFAATGAPARGADGTLPEWSAWPAKAEGNTLMVFDSAAGGGVRMIADVESAARVSTDLAADPRLAEASAACTAFKRATGWFGMDGMRAPAGCS